MSASSGLLHEVNRQNFSWAPGEGLLAILDSWATPIAAHGRDVMGLIDALIGNANKADAVDVQAELSSVLAPGEVVHHAYRLIRDLLVFTGYRLLLVDKQGITGKKVEYHSIPYRAITHYSVETAGTLDIDAELKIWISGSALPIAKTFSDKIDIKEIQMVLATHIR